jgi:nitrogen fixation/metabolism regulation signal transduction histidine kinase
MGLRDRLKRSISYETRILLLALASGLPGVAAALFLLWRGEFSLKVQLTGGAAIVVAWLLISIAQREQTVRPLQTLSNLVAALLEGDYSIRVRGQRRDEPLGLAITEVNRLGEILREQRLGAIEATALLHKIMDEIDVAIFAFDADDRLRLLNRGAERILAQPGDRVIGRHASALGLAVCLEGPAPRIADIAFEGLSGRWEIRRSTFRQEGKVHQLLVLSDLTRALREEERQAWQRVVQVLRHEINNSLAPIHSLAGSLSDLLRRDPPPSDLGDDLHQGLKVIAGRSKALSRFMASYARLAQLPEPQLEPLDVEEWVRRVADLETRIAVEIVAGPPLRIPADGDQLDQLLINLLGNAVDAAMETGGGVKVSWSQRNGYAQVLELCIDDEGPGLPDRRNLFVPFFTTKPAGSGIGLVLSRQIAEAHGGSLTLENRRPGPGCRARLRLPAIIR